MLDVILSANPTLERRIERFRASGADWYNATPVVASERDQILSTAVIFRRSVWTNSGAAHFGGIGAVATRPELRNQGLASAVLAACEELLRSEGLTTAVLFCTIPSFYERLGWSVINEALCRLPVSTDSLSRISVRTMDIQADYPTLSELYDRAATGAMIRSRQLWIEQLFWQREDPSLFLGAFHEEKLVAYARVRRDKGHLEMLETTAAPGFEPALTTLVENQEQAAGLAASISSSTRMMIKDLRARPDRLSSDPRRLSLQSFAHGVPWSPRIWWPVDRF